MRAELFPTRPQAEAARAELDAAAGVPRLHPPEEWVIAEPGLAAERIRARGVRTEHAADILPNDDQSSFAVPSGTAASVEIDADAWRGAGRDRRYVHPRGEE